jgi:hypothetical protein
VPKCGQWLGGQGFSRRGLTSLAPPHIARWLRDQITSLFAGTYSRRLFRKVRWTRKPVTAKASYLSFGILLANGIWIARGQAVDVEHAPSPWWLTTVTHVPLSLQLAGTLNQPAGPRSVSSSGVLPSQPLAPVAVAPAGVLEPPAAHRMVTRELTSAPPRTAERGPTRSHLAPRQLSAHRPARRNSAPKNLARSIPSVRTNIVADNRAAAPANSAANAPVGPRYYNFVLPTLVASPNTRAHVDRRILVRSAPPVVAAGPQSGRCLPTATSTSPTVSWWSIHSRMSPCRRSRAEKLRDFAEVTNGC